MRNKLLNTEEKYGAVTKVFHWVMALLIIAMLIVGNVMEGLQGMDKLKVYGLHKSTGILILFLVFLRFGWRQFTYQPSVPHSPKLPEKAYKLVEFGAKASHAAIYFLMFAMPITGWLMSSGVGFPVSFYGLFTMPNLISPDKEFSKLMNEAHGLFAWALIAILCAHVSAALFHHFYLKDIVMKRMLPIIALVLLSVSANAAEVPVAFTIDKAKSSIKFEAVQNNAPVTGEFKEFGGKILFHPENLAAGKVDVEISPGSVSAAYDDMATTLKGAEWFDAAKFPKASFAADKFSKQADGSYIAEGKLTIRDKTQNLPLKFTLKEFGAKQAVAEASATISRNAFGVGQGEWKDTSAVKDEVRVTIHVVATAN